MLIMHMSNVREFRPWDSSALYSVSNNNESCRQAGPGRCDITLPSPAALLAQTALTPAAYCSISNAASHDRSPNGKELSSHAYPKRPRLDQVFEPGNHPADVDARFAICMTLAQELEQAVLKHEVLVLGNTAQRSTSSSSDDANTLKQSLTWSRDRLEYCNRELHTILKSGVLKCQTFPGNLSSHVQQTSQSSAISISKDTLPSSARSEIFPQLPTRSPSRSTSQDPPSKVLTGSGSHASQWHHSASNNLMLHAEDSRTPEVIQQAWKDLRAKNTAQAEELQRLRSEIADLDRKLESKEARIITLSTDKERLQDQIVASESREQELRQDSLDARAAGQKTIEQYMCMLEQATQLHKCQSNVSTSAVNSHMEIESVEMQKEASVVDQNTSAGRVDSLNRIRLRQLQTEVEDLRTRNKSLQESLLELKSSALHCAVMAANFGATVKRVCDHEDCSIAGG